MRRSGWRTPCQPFFLDRVADFRLPDRAYNDSDPGDALDG